MEEQTARLLELLFIFLGISLRTAGPAIQKLLKAFKEKGTFEFEYRWVGSAVAAFFATWYVIVMMIPADFDPVNRLIFAFGIGFAGNGLINDYVMKFGPLQRYLEKGEVPEEPGE
ncbi:hypothetical protein KAR91_47595 [Candidatus Pacearchaeota archaeon]|nr:hypothetical protein [Candidatus Pacearchaeota archaeon]